MSTLGLDREHENRGAPAEPAADSQSSAPLVAPDPCSQCVLVLAPIGRDAALLTETLQRAGFEAVRCGGIAELCRHIENGAGAAFIAEEALANDALDALQASLRKQPTWSDLPIILMTGGGKATPFSERLARRLEDLGNLTLLERPLRILTLVSAVHAALSTRRRQYQLRALLLEKEDAVRQRDRFVAMLGHELRNPLAAIRTAVEVLDSAPADPNLFVEHCQIIKRQASHLSRLVEDLLDVARATAGKIVLECRQVDLRDIARRSIEDVKLALGVQRHEILFETSAMPAIVHGDPVRLEQVVTNLLANAVKYTPAGGKILIAVFREDGHVGLRVTDSGEGIPPQMLPRIFDPFVQVEQNLERSRGGLGLGLPLVKALVEMHGGSVQASSDGPGCGSEFLIRLPLAAPRPREPREPSPQTRVTATSRRVLIIEDSADSRTAMRALIRLWGHQVVVAEDGPSGVQRAQEFRPEVAFVDIGLPGLNGYEVARMIRDSQGRSICLVALTGYGQPDDKERTRQAGFNEHLVKPVEPEQLARILASPPR